MEFSHTFNGEEDSDLADFRQAVMHSYLVPTDIDRLVERAENLPLPGGQQTRERLITLLKRLSSTADDAAKAYMAIRPIIGIRSFTEIEADRTRQQEEVVAA